MARLLATLCILVAFVALGSSVAHASTGEAAEAAAQRAEDRAFAAIEAEQWCDALYYFEMANRAAPSLDLIWNAAQAADLAGDRKRALKLYVELLGAYPRSKKQRKVNGRVKALTALIAKKGRGERCKAPSPDPVPPAPPDATPPAPASPPGAAATDAEGGEAAPADNTTDPGAPPAASLDPGSAPAAGPVGGEPGTAAPQAGTPSPDLAAPHPASDAVSNSAAPPPASPWPWVLATSGVVLALGGPVVALVGAAPYFEYVAANEEIRAAEGAGRLPGEVDALHARQSTSLADWQSWGQGTAIAGSAIAGVGLVAGVAGVVWALSSPDAGEENP